MSFTCVLENTWIQYKSSLFSQPKQSCRTQVCSRFLTLIHLFICTIVCVIYSFCCLYLHNHNIDHLTHLAVFLSFIDLIKTRLSCLCLVSHNIEHEIHLCFRTYNNLIQYHLCLVNHDIDHKTQGVHNTNSFIYLS